MQVLAQAVRSLKHAVLQNSHLRDATEMKRVFFQRACIIPSSMTQQKGLENTTVAEVLMTKDEEKVGSWLWCSTDDTVYDAVKQVCFLILAETK